MLCLVSLFYLLTWLTFSLVHHKLSSHVTPVSTIYLSSTWYRIASSTGLGVGFPYVGWWTGKQESSPEEVNVTLNWFLDVWLW